MLPKPIPEKFWKRNREETRIFRILGHKFHLHDLQFIQNIKMNINFKHRKPCDIRSINAFVMS